MATTKTIASRIAGRCRRIGWDVRASDNGKYLWMVTCPPCGKESGCAHRTQLHASPSDVNWERVVWRFLENHGFEAAEKAFLEAEERARQAKLVVDSEKGKAAIRAAAERSAAVAKAAGPYAGPQVVDLAWIRSASQWPETKFVIMTPEAAKHLLDPVSGINTSNRPLKEGRVKHFVALIEDGEFGCTHQGGATNTDGVLQDGQSRLEAIRRTGKSVVMQWSIGMPVENFKKVDAGTNRSGRDTVYIKLREMGLGKLDDGTISATARMLTIFEMHGPNSHLRARGIRLSNDKYENAVVAYGERLLSAVDRSKKIKRSEFKKINPSALAAAIYLIGSRLPENDPRVEQFLTDLHTGLGLTLQNDPVVRLRRLLHNDSKRDAWETLAYILKAWNKRAARQTMGNLTWSPGNNEAFPPVFLPPPLDEQAALDELVERELVAA